MAEPYVLTFGPILKEKVGGGRRLAGLGRALAPGVMVGESWEVADLGSTSVGGGGGGEARSVISNGALAGRQYTQETWGLPDDDIADGRRRRTGARLRGPGAARAVRSLVG